MRLIHRSLVSNLVLTVLSYDLHFYLDGMLVGYEEVVDDCRQGITCGWFFLLGSNT